MSDNTKHAELECPECGSLCKPQYDLKDGGASYLCRNNAKHSNLEFLRFTIDENGDLDF